MTDPEFAFAAVPKIIWQWDVLGLGADALKFGFTREISWWQRFWTRVFFGSRWERLP